MARHPFATLLRQPRIARLWAGMALSGLGTELHRMAVLWLAIELVGPQASLLAFAQYAVMLVVSLGAGAFADRWSPRVTMVGADVACAAAAVLPLLAFAAWGPGLPALVLSAVVLAAMGALFHPALLVSVPEIAGSRTHIQGLNALLDATARMARLTGPFAAGALSALMPVLHLLSFTAIGFLASALAVLGMGRFGRPPANAGDAPMPVSRRLLMGLAEARGRRDVRIVLGANTVVLAGWTLGVSLGLPFLVAQHAVAGLGLDGLGAVAALVAAYGAGDFCANLWVANQRPARRGAFMFRGYVILGGALALVPLPLALLPPPAHLPAMMVPAFVAGLGGPMFFIPMMTFLQTSLEGPRLASVIRLRLALVAAAMMAGAGLGPVLFDRIGAATVVGMAGALIAGVGLWGWWRHADLGGEEAALPPAS